MPKQTKPSIVFAHGLWADGSCFQKLIPTLHAEGHEVICSQHGLDSLKSDVDCRPFDAEDSASSSRNPQLDLQTVSANPRPRR